MAGLTISVFIEGFCVLEGLISSYRLLFDEALTLLAIVVDNLFVLIVLLVLVVDDLSH